MTKEDTSKSSKKKAPKDKTRWIKIVVLILVAFILGIVFLDDDPCKPSQPPPDPVPAGDCKPGQPCPVDQPAKPNPLPETPGSGSSASSMDVPGEDVSSSG